MREFIKDKLTVKIFENRKLMGEAVADAVSHKINELLTHYYKKWIVDNLEVGTVEKFQGREKDMQLIANIKE